MYRDFSALGVSVCFTRLMKKMERGELADECICVSIEVQLFDEVYA